MNSLRIPVIKVRDRCGGHIHMVGTDSHDTLNVQEDGGLHYYNLQNGDGTGEGGDYSFVTSKDGWGRNRIEFISIEDFIHICCQHLEDSASREKEFREKVLPLLLNVMDEEARTEDEGVYHT